MPLYGGIDLHANNSVIVLLNEQDKVIYRKRLSNDLPAILEQLAPYHTAIKGLVVESTYNCTGERSPVGCKNHLMLPFLDTQRRCYTIDLYDGQKHTAGYR